ncbi:hypothetical protein [Noviherbaspirillum sp. UKPF54]|uniref:hypothetical protein n=1 Tax=Noviherbaspirillum sp. UKPF54 TaxID=2601898 RepID=UPI001FEFB3D7|nr:hypothetical protein [Noviherbaspirillum sp. UKPF54]
MLSSAALVSVCFAAGCVRLATSASNCSDSADTVGASSWSSLSSVFAAVPAAALSALAERVALSGAARSAGVPASDCWGGFDSFVSGCAACDSLPFCALSALVGSLGFGGAAISRDSTWLNEASDPSPGAFAAVAAPEARLARVDIADVFMVSGRV